MDKLTELIEKKDKVHQRAIEIFNDENTDSELKKEFRNKVSQFDDMYKSLEDMKQLTSSDETRDNLTNQQITVMTKYIRFELDWMQQAIVS